MISFERDTDVEFYIREKAEIATADISKIGNSYLNYLNW